NGRDLYGRGIKSRNALYRNNRDGTFTDVTEQAGVPGTGYGAGCAWGDYDNDGDLDLYVTQWGKCVLYRNNGDGTFTDVTDQAGVGAMDYGEPFHTGAVFFDPDRDGDLDLYVCSYVKFRLDGLRYCAPIEGLKTNCPPQAYHGTASLFFRNKGDGTFENVTRAVGMFDPKGKALSAVSGDYNNDGWTDLFVAHDGEEARLFRNNRDGTFTNVAAEVGVAFADDGTTMAAMGIDWGDYDNDGWLDAFIADFQNRPNHLWRNERNGFFTEVSTPAGVADPSIHFLGFGAFFFDYDNDGWQDIFVANGHVYPEIDQLRTAERYKQLNQLFRNVDDGRSSRKFVEVTQQAGDAFRVKLSSRGASVGDYDNDGDLDILVANNGDAPTLMRNDTIKATPRAASVSERHHASHFLNIQLVGTKMNRDAIGARVTITVGGRTQMREVRGGGSYFSHSDTRVHFGLGQHASVQRLQVQWLGGAQQEWHNVAADAFYRIVEGEERLQRQRIAVSGWR
ncbi:MAG: CRTAC1 family protein, partial [Abditibacteriales bacterium]|nr:CRTAC1 family protein [Abditibacteriales bacterium]